MVRAALLSLAAIAATPMMGVEARTQAEPSRPAAADMLAAEAVRSDLSFLYATLQEAHYDLYAHRPKPQYDALFRQLPASVAAPMSRVEAAVLFQKLAAFGRIGHARIDAPVTEFVSHLGRGGAFLPIFIRVDGDRVFLTATADAGGRLRAGTEILALDGQPIRGVIERLSALVSSERPYMTHAQMEESFPVLLWLDRGSVASIDVAARLEGRPVEVKVGAVTLDGRSALDTRFPTPEPAIDFSAREYREIGDGIAYLRPGPFFNTEKQGDGPSPSYEASAFRKFIDDSFGKALAASTTDLVIDLRNNPGGDNSFSDPMVAWFATRPFRFASSFKLKASAATKADHARRKASGEPVDPELQRLIDAEAKQPDGTRYDYRLPLVAPRAGPRYAGRVWVLVNRHSYSNATSVAALVQDYGFGKIMGEETADTASNYASVQNFTLPATGMAVTYPKSHFVRPSGVDEVAGVVPDIPLMRQPIGVAEDRVLAEALEAIRKARARTP